MDRDSQIRWIGKYEENMTIDLKRSHYRIGHTVKDEGSRSEKHRKRNRKTENCKFFTQELFHRLFLSNGKEITEKGCQSMKI